MLFATTPIRYCALFAGSLLFALQLSTAHAQQLYSWKDKSGRTHYSDAPPPDVNAKPVRGTSAPETAPVAATPNKPGEKTLAEKEVEFRQRRAQAAENEAKEKEAKAEKERQAKQCEEMRSYLAAYQRGPITRPNAKGEREYLSDAERTKAIDDLKTRIQNECK